MEGARERRDDTAPAAESRRQTAEAFARALDHEEYAAAAALLDEECEYSIRGELVRGAAAIIDSYRGNGEQAASSFDRVEYGSEVRDGPDGWVVIAFWDRLTHGGETLEHRCEQWVRVGPAGRITRIEHRDLPGQRESLAEFKRRHGFG